MTRFTDGPAAGQTLMLRRAPLLLRVTEDALTGAFDALDQLTDEPRAGELIHAYRRVGPVLNVHINLGRKGGGFFQGGEYALCQDQPEAEIMRSREGWQRWCQEQTATGQEASA